MSLSPTKQRQLEREELLDRIAKATASFRHHDRVEQSDVEQAKLMLAKAPVTRRYESA